MRVPDVSTSFKVSLGRLNGIVTCPQGLQGLHPPLAGNERPAPDLL